MPHIDLTELDTLEIKITHHADGYRVWLNGPQGLLFRAYRVKKISLDLLEALAVVPDRKTR